MRRYITIIGLGIVNLLHASLHIIQAIQSFLLASDAISSPRHFGEKYMVGVHTTSILSQLLHSPYFAVLWGIIGVFTLYIGIKDYIHHKKCNK